MTIPTSIPFSSIDLGFRARTEHLEIEPLAESIEDDGLIHAIVLGLKHPDFVKEYEEEIGHELNPDQPYILVAGGRRATALALLETQELFYGTAGIPGKPGFVLLEDPISLLKILTLETKENLDRNDMDWRDELRAIVKTWRIAKKKAAMDNQRLLMRDFGAMLGCGYSRLEIADKIYDHFIINPELYKDADSFNGALSVLLKATSNEVARVAVAKSMSTGPMLSAAPQKTPITQALDAVRASLQPEPKSHILLPGESPIVAEVLQDHVIPLTQSFLNCDGLKFMDEQPGGFCDHIICDPDYAIDIGVLDSNPNNRAGIMTEGVNQKDPLASLRELFRLMPLAYKAIREHGFFVFWYALDHHEKLQTAARAAGFAVQGWPIIWNKMDFRGRSNAAPNHNFPKSFECAMVCRKPGTVLRKVQTSCVYTTTGHGITKELNHPFAKPYDIWKFIYSAVANPGQIVFDPFCGSGSSAIAAITYGLRPIGTEINEDIYNNSLINLQNHYRKLLGPHVQFT